MKKDHKIKRRNTNSKIVLMHIWNLNGASPNRTVLMFSLYFKVFKFPNTDIKSPFMNSKQNHIGVKELKEKTHIL